MNCFWLWRRRRQRRRPCSLLLLSMATGNGAETISQQRKSKREMILMVVFIVIVLVVGVTLGSGRIVCAHLLWPVCVCVASFGRISNQIMLSNKFHSIELCARRVSAPQSNHPEDEDVTPTTIVCLCSPGTLGCQERRRRHTHDICGSAPTTLLSYCRVVALNST